MVREDVSVETSTKEQGHWIAIARGVFYVHWFDSYCLLLLMQICRACRDSYGMDNLGDNETKPNLYGPLWSHMFQVQVTLIVSTMERSKGSAQNRSARSSVWGVARIVMYSSGLGAELCGALTKSCNRKFHVDIRILCTDTFS